jgi:hypothetical protein
MSRTSEFGEDILNKTREYIDKCVDEWFTQVKTEGKDSTTVDNKLKVRLPSIEGLAFYLCIARVTVYDWEKRYPEFAALVNQIRNIQADRLINNGLSGDYNSTIAKVILTKHGYVDKTETEHTISELSNEERKRLSKLLK